MVMGGHNQAVDDDKLFLTVGQQRSVDSPGLIAAVPQKILIFNQGLS